MTIDNKQCLSLTNDFALLGLKFLYLSNAGAIIAILANINNFIDEEDFPGISCALGLFIWGLIFAFLANFFGYLMYRSLLITSQSHKTSKSEAILGVLAFSSIMASLSFFAIGAYQAVSIIEYAL